MTSCRGLLHCARTGIGTVRMNDNHDWLSCGEEQEVTRLALGLSDASSARISLKKCPLLRLVIVLLAACG